MKIRKGFVSNSSSSSFIIDSKYSKDEILSFAKQITRETAIDKTLQDVDYILKDNATKYNYASEPWAERQVRAIRDIISLGSKYDDRYLNSNIRISTVDKLKTEEHPDINLDEWYNTDLNAEDYVLYDTYDNFIPDGACEKIINKFKCTVYNTHMG